MAKKPSSSWAPMEPDIYAYRRKKSANGVGVIHSSTNIYTVCRIATHQLMFTHYVLENTTIKSNIKGMQNNFCAI